ncbi:MAG: hypothetical protein IPH58_02615 [Sphingobacteriales bacterium]|jgi:hypothetical protein|nr:hypothetical protein [Sphingobacteriales bacterium]
MKKIVQILNVLLGILLLPIASFAHPGHGEGGGFSITHYLNEPEHLALIFLIIVAVVYFSLRRKRKSSGK